MKATPLVTSALCLFLCACGGDDSSDSAAGSVGGGGVVKTTSPSGIDTGFDENPAIGDTCFNLSPNEAAVACSDNKLLFCSSYYEYKWTETLDCSDSNSTCVAAKDGLSGTCN